MSEEKQQYEHLDWFQINISFTMQLFAIRHQISEENERLVMHSDWQARTISICFHGSITA